MSTSQKTLQANIYVDYVPAELRENKTWEIVFYARNPYTGKLRIRRNRVRPLKNLKERRKLAQRMCAIINNKLARGWTPFVNEENIKSFEKFSDVKNIFLLQISKKVKKNELSIDTKRTYNSFLKNISDYLEDNNQEEMFVFKFNETFVRDFLNEIYYERDNSARTHNNYLRFINTFSKWLLKRKYIPVNPTNNISNERESEKIREYIPLKIRNQIFSYLEQMDYNYLVVCLTCFYCLIRRTEMTKLKVGDVILKNSIIYIESGKSKNRKSLPVTIPKQLTHHFSEHLKKAKNTDYLFSNNNFLPGPQKLKPKKITDKWTSVRNVLKFDAKYQWYALKDTGITNYLELGIPTIDVKNQARHHSITQTEAYIPKSILKAVKNIKVAELNF